MGETRAPLPTILEGVLILSSERDAVDASTESDRLFQMYRLCAAAYLKGVRRVLMLDPERNWIGKAAVAWFNKLLASRNLARMAVRVVGPGEAAQKSVRAALAEHDAISYRRGILHVNTEDALDPLAELQAVAADRASAVFAAAPVISDEDCIGCDACLCVCPQDVLTQIKDEAGGSRYKADPVTCDACGLCADVCPSNAIKVLTMVNAPDDIPLTNWCCSDCGRPVHAPEIQGRGQGSCWICASTSHHKKLYQVLS